MDSSRMKMCELHPTRSDSVVIFLDPEDPFVTTGGGKEKDDPSAHAHTRGYREGRRLGQVRG